MATKVCPICGSEFIPNTYNQKFCSGKCKRIASKVYQHIYYKKTHPTKLKLCPTCGKEFQVTRKHYVYCSAECREKFYGKGIPKDPCWKFSNPKRIPKILCLNCDSKRCRYD